MNAKYSEEQDKSYKYKEEKECLMEFLEVERKSKEELQ